MVRIFLDTRLEQEGSSRHIYQSPFVDVNIEGHVNDIVQALVAQFESKGVENAYVYKYKEPGQIISDTIESILETKKLTEIATPIHHSRTIRNAFDVPSSATTFPDIPVFARLVAPVSVGPPPKRRKIDAEGGGSNHEEYIQRQTANAEATRKRGFKPSEISRPSNFIQHQVKTPVFNGRPFDNAGPPIGLFHNVFNEFKKDMEGNKHIDIPLEIRLDVQEFIRLSANVYQTDKDRSHSISGVLNNLIGATFISIGGGEVESDGSLICMYAHWNAHIVIFELKNEIGHGGLDPFVQASVAFQHYNSAENRDTLRSKCYCPAFLIAIAGPWMCVGGAIYKEAPIAEPLTNYVNVGVNCDREQVERLFFCLNKAVDSLRAFYDGLSKSVGDAVCGFPSICEYDGRKFSYVERLGPDEEKQVYKVKEGDEFRVVKFAKRYCQDAHRLLAEEKDGESFAPALRHVSSSKYGGRIMIVMDYVEGKMAIGETLSNDQYSALERALERLHARGYVFGDLREPNVLLPQKGVSLVDCDWCGKEGKAKYPIDLNTETVKWADGIGPGLLMKKEHDLRMLERLRN